MDPEGFEEEVAVVCNLIIGVSFDAIFRKGEEDYCMHTSYDAGGLQCCQRWQCSKCPYLKSSYG